MADQLVAAPETYKPTFNPDKNEYEADTVLIAVGVAPATEWLDGKIKLGNKGIIEINHKQETSAKDVYAGGDATLVPFAPIEEDRYIALATNSRRQGVTAAKNMLGHWYFRITII